MTFPKEMTKEDMEQEVLSEDQVQKWLEGKEVRKIIIVPGRMINLVV